MLSPRAIVSIGVLLWLSLAPAAFADNTTPQPVATAPPVVAPASVPTVPAPIVPAPAAPEPTAPPAAQPTVAADTGPVVVSRDTHAVQQATQPAATEAAPIPTQAQASEPSVLAQPQVTATVVSRQGNTAAQKASSSSGMTLPPAATSSSTPNSAASDLTNISMSPVSAAAPAQLQCTGKNRPVADPFLSSPYAGWSEINSFVDHDLPDYSVDGKIILANGVTALASAGQESDFFPAYWAPALRQYVNYDGHNGYDFGISYQPVLAAAAGTIEYAGWNSADPGAGYGQMVLINHHNGYVTLYGHLSQLQVTTGDKVAAGQQIGISGTTGHSSGPHLHFSVFHNCQVTDPYGWTGSGPDPLQSFDGETSGYLWLPGHDPLILNPPPNWPAFPTGLHLAPSSLSTLSRQAIQTRVITQSLPPADRLLLLGLPLSDRQHSLTPGVAMVRTQADIAQESEALAPYLSDLEVEGLLDSYQFIPSAGAVWIRGSATAADLEALPGVASLSGVRRADVRNAQDGLAHAVVAQAASQQAPSLWPVGFRSALHAWRPVTSVTCGQPFVTGVSLPGQTVRVALWRHGAVLAHGSVVSDPASGAFVALLTDQSGPISPAAGDTANVTTAGRHMSVAVLDVSVRTHAQAISGAAPPGSTVQINVLDQRGADVWKTLVVSAPAGKYAAHPPRALAVGTLAVASVVDPAGDQVASSAFSPGLLLREGSDAVQGWTVGARPTFWLRRAGRVVYRARIHPAADGSFRLDMRSGGLPMVAQAGDTAALGSARHHRLVRLPSPARATGAVSTRPAAPLATSPQAWVVDLLHPGTATVDVNGDVVEIAPAQPMEIRVGSPDVSAHSYPWAYARFHVYGAHGHLIGAAVADANGSGRLAASIRDWLGRPLIIRPGMRVSLLAEFGAATITVPPVQLSVNVGARSVTVAGPARSAARLSFVMRNGKKQLQRFPLPSSGVERVGFPAGMSALALKRVVVRARINPTTTIEREVSPR